LGWPGRESAVPLALFHYERDTLLNCTFYKMLERTAKGDVAEMQRLAREDVKVKAETPEEQADLRRATEFTPVGFTSFYMCAACAADESRPARAAVGVRPSPATPLL
jgi:hypothetical protein